MRGLVLVALAVLLGIGGGLWCASVTGCGPHLSPAQQGEVQDHIDKLSGCLAEGRAVGPDGGFAAYTQCKKDAGIQ